MQVCDHFGVEVAYAKIALDELASRSALGRSEPHPFARKDHLVPPAPEPIGPQSALCWRYEAQACQQTAHQERTDGGSQGSVDPRHAWIEPLLAYNNINAMAINAIYGAYRVTGLLVRRPCFLVLQVEMIGGCRRQDTGLETILS